MVVRGYHNDVPPRGGAGVRRLIFTLVGEIIFFLFLDRRCEQSFNDVKHCLNTVKSVSTIKNES